MIARAISRVDVAAPEEIKTIPSNDAPVPSSRRPDLVAMIGIQVAQALITAFHASNMMEPPGAPPCPPLESSEPIGTTAFTDEPALVSLYRSWYGSNHVVRLSFVRSKT
jgi:hypothetical protein